MEEIDLFDGNRNLMINSHNNFSVYTPTKHKYFLGNEVTLRKNMRSGFDAWRIFIIYEKTGHS